MSFWSEVHQLALKFPDGDPKPVARRYLSRLGEDELVDLLADAIQTARRQHVHSAEQEAFRALPFDDEPVEGFEEHVTTPAAARLPTRIAREEFVSLLPQSFALGGRNGGRVKWGEATIPQHRARIVMLDKHVRGTLETIAYHKQAIALIEEEQASCLNDVLHGGEAPAAGDAGAEVALG